MTEAILGGLVGSILTTLITRICDLIQKKNEHEYSLKRTFFDRKLHAAEAAISQRFLLISSLLNLLSILDVISENMHYVGQEAPEFLQRLIDSAAKKSEFISAPLNEANVAALYFDLDDKPDIASMREIMRLLVSIDTSADNFRWLTVAYSAEKDVKQREKIKSAGAETLSKLREGIIKLSAKLEEGCQDLYTKMVRLRNEMKKFES